VEDEKILRETLQEALENDGFDVEIATNGEEAITLLNEKPYDLILLDIILPKKDGFQVLKAKKGENKKTPVILLTNLSGSDNVRKALELGARNYLVKSEYRLDEIIDRVKELIN